MKKLVVCFLLLALLALPALAEEGQTVTFDSLTIAEDGRSVTAHITLTESFADRHDTVYLFRVTSLHTGDLDRMMPVASETVEGTKLTVTLPYDATDPSAALYGYVLARLDETGSYSPMSEVIYPDNFADFAPNRQPYPTLTSKKGLQVQLITDAQLLGVKHTVVNAFFNELIAETETDAVTFLYGGEKYYLDAAALSALDYRIRSLTDAGIHVYLNYLLAFDTSASAELYYPDAEGNSSTLFAPNVSTEEGVKRFAAVMHYLAARYTQEGAPYGFCGSYIIGYEVNQEGDRHSTGLLSLSDYAAEYAVLLHTADTAVRSAYRNGRIFLSLSHRWETATEDTLPYQFGGKDLLDKLFELCPNVPFGISVNPYPSDLGLTAFWKDEKATDSPDTPYLTMKNIGVLTEYLKEPARLCQGAVRPVIVGEFGVSGKPETGEAEQVAAYLYAYHTARLNDSIEAFIWHRHVDHAGEKDLFYGLYSASDLLLEPASPKALHSVFGAIDRRDGTGALDLDPYWLLLPEGTKEAIARDDGDKANRVVHTVTARPTGRPGSGWTRTPLFDLSQSLYAFYPTDNAAYLEQCEEDGATFMRVSLLRVSPKEYMGAGITLPDLSRIRKARYLTVRLRVISEADAADLRLLIVSHDGSHEIVLEGVASVACNGWTEVTFPLSALAGESVESGILKLWTKVDGGAGEELFLDVSSLTLDTEQKTDTLKTVFITLILLALLTALLLALTFLLIRRSRKRQA